MPTSLSGLDLTQLTVDQKLELIGLLWDSIPDEALPIPEWHRQEIERRIAELDANPQNVRTWEEIKAQLRGRP